MIKFLVFFLFLLTFQHTQSATLSGTVYGGPSPLANATITVTIAGESEALTTVTTNASGFYTVTVADNVYNLGVAAPSGSSFGSSTVNNLVVSGSNVTQNIILMAGSKSLSGTVYDGNGQLLANVKLHAIDQVSNVGVTTVVSDSNGTFSVGLGAGTYKIAVTDHNASLLQAPMNYTIHDVAKDLNLSTDVSVDIHLPFATISGKTTDANGVPIPGVKISADKNWASLFNGYQQSRYMSSFTTSDANGNYNFIVVKGLNAIKLEPPATSNAAITFKNIAAINESRSEDLILDSKKTLSGTVYDGNGQLLANVKLHAIDQVSNVGVTTVVSDSNGTFSVGLGAGTYKIAVTDHNASLLQAPMNYTIHDVAKDLNLSTDVSVDIHLPFATISGKTTDANGVPIPGVKISADKNWASLFNGYQQSRYMSSFTTSDANGNYNFIVVKGLTSETITPPLNSGFSFTTINGLNVQSNFLQNIILPLPDIGAPVIIGKPLVTSITDSSAVVIWQTNESTNSVVSYGQGGSLDQSVATAQFKREHSVVLNNLASNQIHSYRVSVSDQAGNGPVQSVTLSFKTQITPDTSAPVIVEGPVVTAITHNSAIVEWKTNEPANSEIPGYTSNSVLKINHSLKLTGLNPNSPYSIQAKSTDELGNGPTISPSISFTTLQEPDTKAPVIIAGPMVVNVSQTKATIIWETDEPSISGVSYNDGTSYFLVKDEELIKRHEIHLTNLSPATLYNFTVSSTDGLANGPTLSIQKSFYTLAQPDIEAPIITESIKIVGITHKSAVIHWETDEPSNAVIKYGTNAENLNLQIADSTMKSKHNVQLTGLGENTTYYIKIESIDSTGNSSHSLIQSFSTRSMPDTTPPSFISLPQISKVSRDRAVLEWETNEPVEFQFFYGEGVNRNLQKSDGNKKSKHQVILTNLQGNTSYGFKVIVKDVAGNVTIFEGN